MSKRTGVFDIQLELKDLVLKSEPSENKKDSFMLIGQALETVIR
ncbi:hypothetical protein [Sporosarcina sp. NPDC096371]